MQSRSPLRLAALLLLLASSVGGMPALAQSPARPVQGQRNCTPSLPCTGPQGGTYIITPTGFRHYLPRSTSPQVRVQENCTLAAPCLGPQGGRYFITPEGTRH